MITEKRERQATVRPGRGVRATVAQRRLPDSWFHLWLVVIHSPLLRYFGAKEHAMKSLSPVVTVYFLVGWMLFVCVGSIGVGAAQDCLEPPSGLVSWWPGDGNANNIQDSNHVIAKWRGVCGGHGRTRRSGWMGLMTMF